MTTSDDDNNNNNDEEGKVILDEEGLVILDEEGQVIILDPKRNKVIEFVFEQGGKEGSRRIYIDEKCRWYCIAASLKDAKEGRGKFYKYTDLGRKLLLEVFAELDKTGHFNDKAIYKYTDLGRKLLLEVFAELDKTGHFNDKAIEEDYFSDIVVRKCIDMIKIKNDLSDLK